MQTLKLGTLGHLALAIFYLGVDPPTSLPFKGMKPPCVPKPAQDVLAKRRPLPPPSGGLLPCPLPPHPAGPVLASPTCCSSTPPPQTPSCFWPLPMQGPQPGVLSPSPPQPRPAARRRAPVLAQGSLTRPEALSWPWGGARWGCSQRLRDEHARDQLWTRLRGCWNHVLLLEWGDVGLVLGLQIPIRKMGIATASSQQPLTKT